MTTKYVQCQNPKLKVAIGPSDTSAVFTEFVDLNGDPITQTDFGTVGYGTLAPNTAQEEAVSFVITANTTGEATVTLTRGLLGKAPYGTGGPTYTHQAQTELVISNNPDLFNKLTAKDNDEEVTGSWQFPETPTHNQNPVTKAHFDDNAVQLTGDQTVAGVKTFSSSPIIPDATEDDEAASKGQTEAYADALDAENVKLTGDQTVAGVKTFSSSPVVPDATAANHPYTKGQHDADAEASSAVASPTVRGTAKLDTAADDPLDPEVLTATEERKILLDSLTDTGAVAFGGDGSDGALNVASGTTTLDLSVKTEWNFTTITIASGATLTFSGGTNGDKIPVLRCQGDFVNEGTITTIGVGAPGGVGGLKAAVGAGVGVAGDGEDGDLITTRYVDGTLPGGGLLGTGAERTVAGEAADIGGIGGAASTKNSAYFTVYSINGTGGGGGGGGISANVGTPGDGGNGGNGSLGLVLEVAGNFDNQGTIDVSGESGEAGQNAPGNGINSWTSGAGGGGGGGAAGSFVCRYGGTLINVGTINADGGNGGAAGQPTNTGGSGGSPVDGYGGGGGSGGANSFNNGVAGGNASGNKETGGAGGAGAAGIVYLAKFEYSL